MRKKKSLAKQSSSTSTESEPLYDEACEPKWNFENDLQKAIQTSVTTAINDDTDLEPLYHVLETTQETSRSPGRLNSMGAKPENPGIDKADFESSQCTDKPRVDEGLQGSKFRRAPLSSSDSGEYEPIKETTRDKKCQGIKNSTKSDAVEAVGSNVRADHDYQLLETPKENGKNISNENRSFYASLNTNPANNGLKENAYQPLNHSTLIQLKREGQHVTKDGGRPQSAINIRYRRPMPSPRTKRKHKTCNSDITPFPSPRLSDPRLVPSPRLSYTPTVPSPRLSDKLLVPSPRLSDTSQVSRPRLSDTSPAPNPRCSHGKNISSRSSEFSQTKQSSQNSRNENSKIDDDENKNFYMPLLKNR